MPNDPIKPDYRRQINSLRQNTRYNTTSRRKETKTHDEIMGRTPIAEIIGLYSVDKKTGQLRPFKVPARVSAGKGDKVVIERGPCPEGCERNIIFDHINIIAEREYKSWTPKYKFYVGQEVSFWTADMQYDFQIWPTDDVRFGELVFVNSTKLESNPDRVNKTTRHGKK